ncbi:MAG: PLP-dependent aminotransferase family protein [Pontibacterium sp.]
MADFLYASLEKDLTEAIEQGSWSAGDRLPSIRALAQARSLSKTTVMHALNRLEARGLIESRPKAGFFVRSCFQSSIPATIEVPTPSPAPVSVNEITQELMRRSAAFDILPEAGDQEETTPGLVQLNRTLARALRNRSGQKHQYYDEPAGSMSLRTLLTKRYRRLGCQFEAGDITVTAGCQQAMFFALMCVCQRGDLVVVESPGFYGILQLLEALGLQVLEIPACPETGLDLVMLEQVLSQWPVKACVVTPAFSTPGGAVMPLENRARLLSMAELYDFTIVEDDIYGDLSFSHRIAPLQASDPNGRVMLCGSVSKTLSRDLRLGWVVSVRHHKELQRLKLVTSLAGSRFVQQGVAAFIEEGDYDRHVRRYVHQLQRQRDELIHVIQHDWQVHCRFSVPQGGLTLWVQLPESIDTLGLYGCAREAGVLITPGALFSASGYYKNCLRISYAHCWNPVRKKALLELGRLLERAL